MMKYLLNTNACIVFLNRRSDKLKQRLALCQPQQIVLCLVVKAELFYGKIRRDLSAIGQPIGANDFMIATIALANQVTLITHNTREFSRVSGLLLEDWEL